MKDFLLIDSELLTPFWAEVMDTTNYLQNKLPTKCIDRAIIISEEVWTGVRENLKYIWILKRKISAYISFKKWYKSNVYKTWNDIIIEYTNTTKHLKVWAPKTHQILITNKLIINKLKIDIELLIKYSMSRPKKLLRQPVSKPRPKRRPTKKLHIENEMVYNDLKEVVGKRFLIEQPNMRAEALKIWLSNKRWVLKIPTIHYK